MAYVLGTRSRAELATVHPDLARVVERAIAFSEVDFGVYDGARTLDEQRAIVASGASQTLDSRHLPGPHGHAYAVDLVPWIGGKYRWDWPALFKVAEAMRAAAVELGVPLRWGAAWDVDFTATTGPASVVSDGYVTRRKAAGRKAFLDGPHFELPVSRYP